MQSKIRTLWHEIKGLSVERSHAKNDSTMVFGTTEI